MATPNDDLNFDTSGGIFDAFKKAKDLEYVFNKLYDGINDINKGLGETRLRAVEFSNAVSDSVASVIRLGGNLNDVDKTITAISAGARRNVIETTETIGEIFAAAQLIGETADPQKLVGNFQEVGLQIANIGETVAESIGYVNSLGLNSRTIMNDVVNSMTMMNRFNFQDGVMGLTKMAAQASMLRFDMSLTKNFADSVMNPDGAIKMASAFQRLGIMSGDLVDPFVLMDKSINDPGGLQDSLINMTKQFTIFDEKTQSFKIAPGAQRQLAEIASELNISAEQMSKTALAAADMDRRLSQINLGIDASEDDKMLVANMAKMGSGQFKGDYVVQIKDAEGKDQIKRLSELQTQDFEKLREIQETAPKTVEEIQRSQLGVMETIQRDIAALPFSISFALAGQDFNVRTAEAVKRGLDDVMSSVFSESVMGQPDAVRKEFQKMGDEMKGLMAKAYKGDTQAMDEIQTRMLQKAESIPAEVLNKAMTTLGQLGIEKPRSPEEAFYNEAVKKAQEMARAEMGTGQKTETVQKNVNINGQVRFVIDAPAGVDTQKLTQYVESPEFRNALNKVLDDIEETGTKPLSKR